MQCLGNCTGSIFTMLHSLECRVLSRHEVQTRDASETASHPEQHLIVVITSIMEIIVRFYGSDWSFWR